MSVRTTLGSALAATLALGALAVGSAPAHAAYVADADDTAGITPVATDVIGVGSDTSQHALKLLGDAWNAATPAPTSRLVTYAATSGGDLTLPGEAAAITRPNGSGAGKGRLYGANNVAAIDFARSSSTLSSDEIAASLKQFPFALDTLKMAVSKTSNAPASVTPADLVNIYNGTYDNWSDLPGSTTSGVIAPKIPQSGSGTRSFFEAQLKAANGGTAVVLAGTVTPVQEHDDTAIKNDPNAIAPFSAGRADLLGTLRLEGGFSAERALYNVVRGTDVAKPEITALFGPDGFLCSEQAAGLIKQAGFDQLATPDDGGVCGVQTTSATTDFSISGDVAPVTTTAGVTGTHNGNGAVVLKAAINGSKTPEGTVTFREGGSVVKANVPLIGGTATASLTGVPVGSHTYTAVYAPKAGTVFQPSTGTVTVVVTAGPSAACTAATAKADTAQAKVAKLKSKLKKAKGTAKKKVKVKLKKAKKALKAANSAKAAAC